MGKRGTLITGASCVCLLYTSVVDGADLQERKAYSMAILNSIREGNRKRARLSTAFVENRETLEKRLEAIVDMQHKKAGRMVPTLFSIALVFCFCFVGCTPVESQDVYKRQLCDHQSFAGRIYWR